MDPRQRRTRTQLRSAILELAARQPVGSLTVAEVARAAGVTRDTFYRHAAGPVELLADVLTDELEQIDLPAHGDAEDFLAALHLLLEHVAGHAPVYRAALVDSTEGRIREILHDVVAARLDAYLAAAPAAVPRIPGGAPPEVTRRVLVAHCAAGTVAAITVWLGDGAQTDVAALARTILAAGPTWWSPEHAARTLPADQARSAASWSTDSASARVP